MSSDALAGDVSVISVLSIVVAAIAAAESGIVLKLLPSAHPVVTNAVGMSVSRAAARAVVRRGRVLARPQSPSVWASLIYLVIASPFLFMLFVYVIRRWTAPAPATKSVLFPIVSVIGGALLLGEDVDGLALLGAPLVLLGVYVGALSGGSPVDTAAPARDAR